MDLKTSPLIDDFNYLLDQALTEDLDQNGDITSNAIFTNETSQATIFARQEGIISGIEAVELTLVRIDPQVTINCLHSDGEYVSDKNAILQVHGKARSLLLAERIALNFIGFFSGIATKTKHYVSALGNSSTRILDSRKTLPAYRRLAKSAVLDGSGANHRRGLYDMVLVKDNHIVASGGLGQAVAKIRDVYGRQYFIEVEASDLAEVEEALKLKVDRIMLDNMSFRDCKKSLKLRERIQGQNFSSEFEASGDFTIERIIEFAPLNLEYISVGALTHSVPNFNFSMQFQLG